mmetsp:Transcript_19831/g.46545  ORF Transcript_19831/g.46545 Transcript_19831/m.46545 type:complete len:306 (-) Transcript_19831:1102-2019(-)
MLPYPRMFCVRAARCAFRMPRGLSSRAALPDSPPSSSAPYSAAAAFSLLFFFFRSLPRSFILRGEAALPPLRGDDAPFFLSFDWRNASESAQFDTSPSNMLESAAPQRGSTPQQTIGADSSWCASYTIVVSLRPPRSKLPSWSPPHSRLPKSKALKRPKPFTSGSGTSSAPPSSAGLGCILGDSSWRYDWGRLAGPSFSTTSSGPSCCVAPSGWTTKACENRSDAGTRFVGVSKRTLPTNGDSGLAASNVKSANAAPFFFPPLSTLIVEPSEAPGESASTCLVLSGLAILIEWSSWCLPDGMFPA